jgi:hypothetical protein
MKDEVFTQRSLNVPLFWLAPEANALLDVVVDDDCCWLLAYPLLLLLLPVAAAACLTGVGTLSSCEKLNVERPPGGACTLVVLRSVMKLPMMP